MDLEILPRRAWHAFPPTLVEPVQSPVEYVFCMNTHTGRCENDTQCEDSIRRMQHLQMAIHNRSDIRFNFLIGEDGNVYEGRGWGVQPFLPSRFAKFNEKSVVIGFIGEFTENDLPPIIAELREQLVDFGLEKGYIKKDFQPIEILALKERF